VKRNPYETVRYLTEYLLFHYGQPRDLCPFGFVPREMLRFHERIRKECLLSGRFGRRSSATRHTRALDLGCSVGRFTFELGRVADEVLGVDNSRAFVRAAKQLAQAHQMSVQVKESGKHFVSRTLRLPLPLRAGNVRFQVGDAMDIAALPSDPFHIVAAINLICRLPRPRLFLSQLHRLVAPRGRLVIASPFTWSEEYTPQREWLTHAQVESVLTPHFRVIHSHDLPFLIREHGRKFQLIVSDVMVFLRQED